MIKYTVEVHKNGTKKWYMGDKLHREDGPAIEFNGYKSYYLNDQLHREDGPAVESNGYKAYYLNDQLHREDGPAIERPNGSKYYYLNGKCLTKKEWVVKLNPVREMTVAEISKALGYDVKVIK